MLLAVADERRHHEADGPRDHATMMREFTSDGLSSPGAQALAHTLIGPFAAGGEAAARASRDYYDFTIKLTSAGLEGLLQGRWQAPHRH